MFYAIPSFCAIIIKAWLLWRGKSQAGENGALILLLGALLSLNMVEFNMFILPQEIAWLMHLYYCAAVFAAASILNLFLCLTGDSTTNLKKINGVLAVIIGAGSLVPGVIIAGVENIGYTFMRIPGTLYIVWAVYIVSTLLFSVILLIAGYRSSKDVLQRRRCLAILLGLLPFICIAIAVIFLMIAGVRINATVILSSAVIFFLFALIYSEQRYGLFKILARVPFTEEYALRTELVNQVKNIESNVFGSPGEIAFKDQIKKIESLYIDLAIIANDGNKTHAATALGISNATLHRKATRKQQQVVETRNPEEKSKVLPWTPTSRYSTLDE